MSGTSIIAELVGKPYALCSWVIKVCWSMRVPVVHEAKNEPVWTKVVDRPWLNVVQLDELKTVDSQTTGEGCEYAFESLLGGLEGYSSALTWVTLNHSERAANKIKVWGVLHARTYAIGLRDITVVCRPAGSGL